MAEKNLIGELDMYREAGIKPNFSDIAKRYGKDRHTVAAYWRAEGGRPRDGRADRAGSFDAHIEEVAAKAQLPGVTKKGIHEWLLHRYPGENLAGYNAFTQFMRKNGIAVGASGGPEPHPRFETPPGLQLQFDWKESVRMANRDGELFEFNVFAATLGHSRRHIFIRSGTRTTDDLVRCMYATIARLGGVPREWVTDNMSALVTIKGGRRLKVQRAYEFAKAAGFEIPADATILAAECKEVSDDEPLTHEKLAPVQAVLKADDKEQAFEMCEKMLKLGAGHTAAIHTNNQELVREYGVRMHACRIIWNQPSSLGGIGDIYNSIAPSLTLGCGSYGGNSVSGNVQAVNLLNIKRIARRNNNMQWFKIPAKTYFEPNAIKYLRDMYGIEKAVIVCDKVMEQLGVVDKIIDQLRARSNRVTFRIIDYVEPEPSVETVERGATMMREEFEPDTIIAVGGGSPMDASKIMWLLYEHPEISFSDVREKFFDIRKRAFKIPPLGKKAKLVCIPTSSGTGSEVTPFAVITDHKTGYKYPITDYALTPSVAIVDPVLARTQPRKLASDAGFDALTHSMEAYVSVYANDFTDGMALHAAKLIWDNLAESVNGEPGEDKIKAQEKMHNAATMAGMAFGSAFLGMCHGMAHTIGALCHVAHGRTNSILLPYVIRYNGSIPEEPTSWPKYNKYVAPERYQEIAKNLGVNPGKTPEEGVENLAKAVEDYRDNKLGMNKSFQECGVDEDYFWSVLDQIGMRAYEDQCAPANPRIPQIEDMKDIAIAAYYGVSQEEGHKLRIEREGEAATEEASER